MKKGLFILLGVLLLVALGNYFYKKYITKPKIKAEVFLNRVLIDKKISYIVNYSGIIFRGVYDLNKKEVQEQTAGNFKIQTFKNGLIFGLNILKDGKVQQTILFDISTQKLTLDL